MLMPESFDELRRRAARESYEVAASHPDPNEGFWIQACADDLARDLTDAEREMFRALGVTDV
jgi:hypothetical protein